MESSWSYIGVVVHFGCTNMSDEHHGLMSMDAGKECIIIRIAEYRPLFNAQMHIS